MLHELENLLQAAVQARRQRRFEEALHHYGEIVRLYRAQGEIQRLAHAIRHVADIEREAGFLARAEASYHHALDLYATQPQTPPLELGNALRGLAVLLQATGHTAQALLCWTQAHRLYTEAAIPAGIHESAQRIAALSA